MARLLLALVALAIASPAGAQPRAAKPAAGRATAAEAALVAYTEARPPAAPSRLHDMRVNARPNPSGGVDRVSSRRAFVEKGALAAVSFQGSPRDPSAPVEPPAQPLFVGVSLAAR